MRDDHMMQRFLRRVGGLRRLILMIVCSACALELMQAVLQSSTNAIRQHVDQVHHHEHAHHNDEHAPQKKTANFSDFDNIEPASESVVSVTQSGAFACNLPRACTHGELAIRLSATISEKSRPSMCINGLQVLNERRVVRGFNLAVIDENSNVLSTQYFDTTHSDEELRRYLATLEPHTIITGVTWGDVDSKISISTRKVLKAFGIDIADATAIAKAWAFIGQLGLTSTEGKVVSAGAVDGESGSTATVADCVKMPMGKLRDVIVNNSGERPNRLSGTELEAIANAAVVAQRSNVMYGDRLEQCGMRESCTDGEIAMSFYSGKNKDDEPKICVDGRFVIGRSLNGAGRGLNIVIVHPKTKEVLRVGHFDTYAEDSSTLEIFLEQVAQGELVAIVSFDEAATRLSTLAKQLLYDIGSGLVQNMKFRASWFMVGQKGISGFTPFEELNYASNNEWAKPIDRRVCVPPKLDGQKTHADPLLNGENSARRAFCSKYDGYQEFCDDAHIDDNLTPAPPLPNSGTADVVEIPMLIIAGLAHNSLRMCLDTVLRQPGIKPSNVLVAYDENYKETADLATLFGFRSAAVNVSSSYMQQYAYSLDVGWSSYPNANELIVVEEELLLTADFMHYMNQLLPVLRHDKTLAFVSAWNDNGFESSSGLGDAVYRIDDGIAPLLGYMMTKSFYREKMRPKFAQCCVKERVWENGWKGLLEPSTDVVLIPDVSRVVRRRADGLGAHPEAIKAMFHRQRSFQRSVEIDLSKPMETVGSNSLYDSHLRLVLSTAIAWNATSLPSCMKTSPQAPTATPLNLQQKQALAVYIENDAQLYHRLAMCFGAFYPTKAPESVSERTVRGLYKGVMRLAFREHPLLIVPSDSVFNKHKPSSYNTITLT